MVAPDNLGSSPAFRQCLRDADVRRSEFEAVLSRLGEYETVYETLTATGSVAQFLEAIAKADRAWTNSFLRSWGIR